MGARSRGVPGGVRWSGRPDRVGIGSESTVDVSRREGARTLGDWTLAETLARRPLCDTFMVMLLLATAPVTLWGRPGSSLQTNRSASSGFPPAGNASHPRWRCVGHSTS